MVEEDRMSTHDRGAFGALLAEAKELGAEMIRFEVDLVMDDVPEEERWEVACGPKKKAFGRTGEEGLRGLVEMLRSERKP